MGCDIHMFLERKVNNKWVMVNEIDNSLTDRDYSFFSDLAGVRGEGPKPKGLPDDISDSVKLNSEDYGSDGHSHSFYLIKEIIPIILNHKIERDYQKENPEEAFFEIYEDRCTCCDQVIPTQEHRVVFWFDN